MEESRQYLSNELTKEDVEKVEKINIVHDQDFSYYSRKNDPLASDHGEISTFFVQAKKVDASRCMLSIQDYDISRSFGVSTLDKILTAVKGINIAQHSITNAFLQYKMLLLKYPGGIAGSEVNPNKMVEASLKKIKNEYSSSRLTAMPQSMNFENIQTDFNGVAQGADFLWSYLASELGWPKSKLMGLSKGVVSAGERDQRDWYELIHAQEQLGKYDEPINFLNNILKHEEEGAISQILKRHNIDPSSIDITIEWNPMRKKTDTEISDIDLKNSQTMASLITNRIISREEARNKYFPELPNLDDVEFDDEPNELPEF